MLDGKYGWQLQTGRVEKSAVINFHLVVMVGLVARSVTALAAASNQVPLDRVQRSVAVDFESRQHVAERSEDLDRILQCQLCLDIGMVQLIPANRSNMSCVLNLELDNRTTLQHGVAV